MEEIDIREAHLQRLQAENEEFKLFFNYELENKEKEDLKNQIKSQLQALEMSNSQILVEADDLANQSLVNKDFEPEDQQDCLKMEVQNISTNEFTNYQTRDFNTFRNNKSYISVPGSCDSIIEL